MKGFNERVIENVVYRRLAPFLLLLALLVAIVAAVGTYANTTAINRANSERIAAAQDDAVTNCENGNESRQAARTLWNYVLDASQAGHKGADEQQAAFVNEFRAWINKVYQPHDCSDLGRKYPLPPPPTIPTAS